MIRATWLILFGVMLILASSPARAEIAGHAVVVDGNTLKIGDKTVVLYGINAPKIDEFCLTRRGETYPCGEAAVRTLSIIMQNKDVSCVEKGPDQRGVMRAICTVEGVDMNRILILNGWAVAYREESEIYLHDQRAAWATREGMWKSITFRAEDVKGRKP